MRDLARCCVVCKLIVEICGTLSKKGKCADCAEDYDNQRPDTQDDMKMEGIEELEPIITETRPKFYSQ